MGGWVSVFPVEAFRLRPGAGGTSGTQQVKDNNFAGVSPGVWIHFFKPPSPEKENKLEKSKRVALKNQTWPWGRRC